MLKKGIYEQVINKEIGEEIANKEEDLLFFTDPIDKAEASQILAKYVSSIIRKGLDDFTDVEDSVEKQVDLVNKIVSIIKKETQEQRFEKMSVDKQAEILRALLSRKENPNLSDRDRNIVRPVTSIAQSSLFTGATHEPQMFTELKNEILSCDRIDMLVSFVKWSGLRLIINQLRTFTQKGGKLRVITTSYMGATDGKAIEELSKLPNTEIKVSYDTKRTRLHAKTYIFHRDTGFTTAYIGSSNLSNAAISSGLEWNVKVTEVDLPETMKKIRGTFEIYWESKNEEFEFYDDSKKEKLFRALKAEKYGTKDGSLPFAFDIQPYPYQQEILDKLDAERKIRNHYRNLVVAATGTGKTVISAFDYKKFRKKNSNSPCRLLFIAHREEILKQSLATFQGVLKDPNFGELFVGNYKPDSFDYLFMSIQTFNSQNLAEKTNPDYYDYIVIDEFHHAAAPSYQKLLSYYTPKILLGLTATPERMDGKDVLEYFDNRIAAEIRLPEAIDRKLLCPFQYFGVSDTVDLNLLKWSRGGYDRNELERAYLANKAVADRRADYIIKELNDYVTDMDDVKGLGFCVTREHARFMADYFNQCNIPSISLNADSSEEERNSAKDKLVNGDVRFIFVVDLYNEGVDIPEINTILFLRPTESLTVFLQQLGRGLRLSEGKDCLTVLDFIGQANAKYNFEGKFAALLANTTLGVQREIKNGFVSLPKGCYIQLEKKAQKIILENIASSYGNKAGLISKIQNFNEETGKVLSFENFIDFYHLDLRSIYKCDSFARLCVLAGVKMNFVEPLEETMKKAFFRFASVDSRRLITFWKRCLTEEERRFSNMEIRMLNMFQFTIWQKSYQECGYRDSYEIFRKLKNENPILTEELIELLNYRFKTIDFIDEPVNLGFDCPLDLYCCYSRDQILVAMDMLKPNTVREGVKYLPGKKIDIAFVTLNKSENYYSPSTMYEDYSINDRMFHWQTQSKTSEDSPTGQRYIHGAEQGVTFLLFVREYRNDKIMPTARETYTFLGKARYHSHEGSCPMSIVLDLEKPIPAKFLRKTNKMISN